MTRPPLPPAGSSWPAGLRWGTRQRARRTSGRRRAVVCTDITLARWTLRGSHPTPLPPTMSCDNPANGAAAKPAKTPPTANISAQGTVNITLKTSVGDIPLTLDRTLAPCAVNSFVSLSTQGYYDNTSCHRLSTQG